MSPKLTLDKIRTARQVAARAGTVMRIGQYRLADDELQYAIELLQEAQKLLRRETTDTTCAE